MWAQKLSGDLYRDIGSWQEAIIYYEKALDALQILNNNLQNNCKLLRLRDSLFCLKATIEAKMCYEQQRYMKILLNSSTYTQEGRMSKPL